MNLPKITIIIPSYNQGIYIEKTLTSLFDQNYPKLEVIVFDAGSDDETIDVLKKYNSQISYWVSEPDKGQSDAINKGLRIASGEICNWLCSDDYLEPGSLHKIGEAFTKNEIKVVTGNVRVFDNKDVDFVKEGTLVYDNLAETIATSVNIQPVTFFKLQHFKDSGLLSENLHYFMDKELWMKFLFQNGQEGVKNLDSTIAHYLLHPQSKTFQEMDPEMFDPKSKFKIDNNSIFHHLAERVNNTKQANIIASLTDSLLNDYKFNFISDFDQNLTAKVVDIYLYHEAKKNFYKKKYRKCIAIIKTINTFALPLFVIILLFILPRKLGIKKRLGRKS